MNVPSGAKLVPAVSLITALFIIISLQIHTKPSAAPNSEVFSLMESLRSTTIPTDAYFVGDTTEISRVYDEGATTMPRVNAKGATTMPRVNEKGATTMPRVNEKAATTMPRVNEKGATTMPRVNEKAATTMPRVNEKAATTMPRVNEKGATTMPRVNEKAATTMSRVYEKNTKVSSPFMKKKTTSNLRQSETTKSIVHSNSLNKSSTSGKMQNQTTSKSDSSIEPKSGTTTRRTFTEVNNQISTGKISTVLSTSECEAILSNKTNVSPLEYRIQIIAATPGSGSDWCYISLSLLTGFLTGSVYDMVRLKDVSEIPYRPLYYKTHFPFLPSYGPVDDYINLNPVRVVVLIRNPFDAGFSEWIRYRINIVNENKDNKYNNLNKVIGRKDFIERSENGVVTPSTGFQKHYEIYLRSWSKFHNYWLNNYTGEVKVVLYQSLVDDILGFKDIAYFFGFDTESTLHRKERVQCFLGNVEKTKHRQRPFSAMIEEVKEVLRKYYAHKTQSAWSYLEVLYKDKYSTALVVQ